MKKITTVFLLLLSFFTFYGFDVHAITPPIPGGPYEINSPVSPNRPNPTNPRQVRPHKGIDLPMDNKNIYAPANGTVQRILDPGGWGAAVIFTFGPDTPYPGQSLLFAHLNVADLEARGLGVSNIKEGEVMGIIIGTSGNSTGPHAHIEYYPKGYGSNFSILVKEFLLGLGMNIQGEGVKGGLDDKDIFKGFDKERPGMAWNVEAMMGLGNNISDIMQQFVTFSSKAFDYLSQYIPSLLIALCIIDLALMISLSGFRVTLMDIIPKITKYGIYIYILQNWKTICNSVFKGFVSGFSNLLNMNGGNFAGDVSQPQLLLQKILHLIQPALNKISAFGARDFISNFGSAMVIYLLTAIVIIVFVAVALYIMVCYIEFYLSMVFNIVSLPFGVLHWTKFSFEGTLNHLINAGVKILLITVLVGLSSLVIKDAQLNDIFGATVDSTAVEKGQLTDTTDNGYVAMIYEAAEKFGVDGNWLLAIAMRESGGDTVDGISQDAYNPDGPAWGVMQITEDQQGLDENGNVITIETAYPNFRTDAWENIQAGAAIYKYKVELFANGDFYTGAGWYYGSGNTEYANKIAKNVEAIAGIDPSIYKNPNKNPHKITAEQLITYLSAVVIICFFGYLILRIPERIMNQLGGSSGGVSLP